MKIDEDKIGAVIGTGGKVIKGISEQTGSDVNINDDGKILIYGKNQESAEAAERMIKMVIEEPEVGRVYQGTVKRLMDFGAFVEILPGKEGLVHISKLARDRVNHVEDVLQLNQEIPVKLMEIDRQGRLNLSYIDAIDPEGASSISGGGRDRNESRDRNEGRDRKPHGDSRDRDRSGGRSRDRRRD
jgi:polyribonucleotide nucleotidyltransferase